MIEILHFCPSKSFSGLEQYAVDLAGDQKSRGRDIGFVVAPSSLIEKECHARSLTTLAYDEKKFLGGSSFRQNFSRLLQTLKVIHLHSTQEVTHIAPFIFWLKLLRKPLPKIILQVHIWINHKRRDPLHRLVYSIVDEIWCSSQMAKVSLLEHLPIKESKFKIINYGRDLKSLSSGFLKKEEARQKLGLSAPGVLDRATVIGTISRFEKSKGIREFLEASVAVLKSHSDVHFVLIGGPSSHNKDAEKYTNDLKTFVNSLKPALANRIHFLGAIENAFKFLKAFDLYVLPSYEECFSLAMLDAQGAGLPVIGSQSGGTPEVVRPQKTGWLFKPRDVRSLESALSEALEQKSLWPNIGEVARSRVFKDFDQKLIFESILREYDL